MSLLLSGLGIASMAMGALFLLAAALGLWRLPDQLSRLHALTKADTAGLALIALGALLWTASPEGILPLVLIVLLAAISGATVGHLIARIKVGRLGPRSLEAERRG